MVIYQMGKVASKTIDATLTRVASAQVFHAHLLDPANLQRRRSQMEADLGKVDTEVNIVRARALHEHVLRSLREIKIITLVREPISRNISAYYQGLDRWARTEGAHDRVPVDALIEIFLREYPHQDALTWFDDEFRAVTGIDVYASAFPQEQGFQRIRHGNMDVLIMRHDLDDRVKAERISELLNLPGLKIVQDNRAEDKEYRDSYHKFRQTIRLPERYVEEMLNSKYAAHFFSDPERQRLRDKWLRPPG